MAVTFTLTERQKIFVSARSLSFPGEDRDRMIYQSAHTVAGRRAPLPLREIEALEVADAEYSARMNNV